MMVFIRAIFVIMALRGPLPIWPHSKNWSFRPIAGVSSIIVIVLIVLYVRH
jgi:hypothetical protein